MRARVYLAACIMLSAAVARADFFALDVDAQAGYLKIENIERPASSETTALSGAMAGVRGKLEILFLCLLVDYQHLFSNADYLHAGLGADFKLPLGFIEPYARASVGLMLLTATEGAFSPRADAKLDATAGFQARGGAGLDIPLGDWFALGLGADIGYHYITGKSGWDLSVVGYLGLRI